MSQVESDFLRAIAATLVLRCNGFPRTAGAPVASTGAMLNGAVNRSAPHAEVASSTFQPTARGVSDCSFLARLVVLATKLALSVQGHCEVPNQ